MCGVCADTFAQAARHNASCSLEAAAGPPRLVCCTLCHTVCPYACAHACLCPCASAAGFAYPSHLLHHVLPAWYDQAAHHVHVPGKVRDKAAQVQDEAAQVQDKAAQVQDEAAQVQDEAAQVQDLRHSCRSLSRRLGSLCEAASRL
jgi:hypothetical protein